MSVASEINRLVNQIYAAELIMKAFRMSPNTYCGITLHDTEAHTLELIAANEGISQAQLSEMTFRTKGSTSVMVDKLIEKGLVCRERLSEDRRSYYLLLTEKGRAVNQAHLDFDAVHAEEIAAKVTVDEDTLRCVNEVLEQLTDIYAQYQREQKPSS